MRKIILLVCLLTIILSACSPSPTGGEPTAETSAEASPTTDPYAPGW